MILKRLDKVNKLKLSTEPPIVNDENESHTKKKTKEKKGKSKNKY
eukprot:UN07652